MRVQREEREREHTQTQTRLISPKNAPVVLFPIFRGLVFRDHNSFFVVFLSLRGKQTPLRGALMLRFAENRDEMVRKVFG